MECKTIKCNHCGTIVGVYLDGICLECWQSRALKAEAEIRKSKAREARLRPIVEELSLQALAYASDADYKRLNDALADDGRAYADQYKLMMDTLNDIYPTLAGRVIQLQESGEEKAAAEWDAVCRKVLVVLEVSGDGRA